MTDDPLILAFKLALGAIILVGGLYNAKNAFRFGKALTPTAGALIFLMGIIGIGVGIGLMLTGIYPE